MHRLSSVRAGRSDARDGDDRPVRIAVAGSATGARTSRATSTPCPGAELAWGCDERAADVERVAAQYPGARVHRRRSTSCSPTRSSTRCARDAGARPTATLAERVLDAGKHCFVEKPLAQSLADAERAVGRRAARGRVLMVGHLLEYHPGVRKLKEIIDAGELGEIHYIYSNRLNLGQLRADENALWSLGAHDVSVILHLAGEEPYELTARGECYMRPGIEDVVFAFLRFPSGLAAHLHLSWLDPHKERRFTVVGSRRMATFDDMDLERKVTIYDKGFDEDATATASTSPARATSTARASRNAEPLRSRSSTSSSACASGARRVSDGESGLRVVRVLEELQRSLDASRRSARRR